MKKTDSLNLAQYIERNGQPEKDMPIHVFRSGEFTPAVLVKCSPKGQTCTVRFPTKKEENLDMKRWGSSIIECNPVFVEKKNLIRQIRQCFNDIEETATWHNMYTLTEIPLRLSKINELEQQIRAALSSIVNLNNYDGGDHA